MRNEEEQIEALLRGDLTGWIQEQIVSGSDMSDRNWHDFFSITPEALTQHVIERGFPLGAVWQPGHPPTEKNDRLVVEPGAAGQWRVYYIERGRASDERVYATRDEASRDAVLRLMNDAWVRTNQDYWYAHKRPTDVFPPFGGELPPR